MTIATAPSINMASRPTHWRVLAALSAPCLGRDAGPNDLGAVGELADLVGLGTEVRFNKTCLHDCTCVCCSRNSRW